MITSTSAARPLARCRRSRATLASTLGIACLLGAAAAPARAQPADAARGAERSDAPERADAFLGTSALNRFAQSLLPVPIEIPASRAAGVPASSLTIDEARFCGTTAGGHGRLLAVVRRAGGAPADAGPAPAQVPASVLGGEEDCALRLSEIAGRGGGDGGAEPAAAAAVVEILAAWAPSRLRLSLGEIAGTRGGGAGVAQALARAKAAGPLATVETGAINLATSRTAMQSLALAIAFPPGHDGVWLTAVPAERAPPPRQARPAIDPASMPGSADTQLMATIPFANRVLAVLGQDGPLVLKLNGQTVEVRDLHLGGVEGTLTVWGRATSRERRETVRVTIEAAGPDLKIVKVRAEAEPESCAAMSAIAGIGCRARNTARSAGAATAAATLNDRYRGQLLRSLSSPPTTTTEIDGLRLRVGFTPIRVQSLTGAVSIAGRIEIEKL
jgi:hypothetical protein